jgi:hypothetical protein
MADGMGGARSMHEAYVQAKLYSGNLKGETTLERSADWKIILKWIYWHRIGTGGRLL